MAEASASFLQRVSYFRDFHLREVDHQPGLFPLSPSAALLDDQTSTPVNHRRSEDTPLGCRVRHTPRVRRSPWQVHQKCPGEKQNSLETPAVNSEKVPRAALATSKRSFERWAFVWFIHLLYLLVKPHLNILHSGTICSLINEEEAGETALSDGTA